MCENFGIFTKKKLLKPEYIREMSGFYCSGNVKIFD